MQTYYLKPYVDGYEACAKYTQSVIDATIRRHNGVTTSEDAVKAINDLINHSHHLPLQVDKMKQQMLDVVGFNESNQ